MKQYSFNITAVTLEEFKKLLPTHKSKKILKSYLLNEYELPEILSDLQADFESEKVVQPYWMADDEINKLDLLVKQAKLKDYNLSRSAIMRDIMKNLVELYRNNPIQKSEYGRQTFKVPTGTKKRLSSLIEDRELSYELSSFIMEGYIPSNNFPSMRNQEQENLDFKSDIDVFNKLDEVAEEYGFKKGRAKIFRDALSQFEKSLQSNPIKKAALKQELKYLLDEYKTIEDVAIIREVISNYLKE
ncbi:hypothetical protein CEQ21_07650 (plasmid) [Niallia circulans]|uniref:Uncharacterized protein n=1 Tax=Niallia circulans TaxID=1397 RepID=A0A553SQG3_NIACI|nr:hypothetical protein [Niallia circulans]TRZ39234.1 hypothetical protein CEQ21_07650 [Niallia circulans]